MKLLDDCLAYGYSVDLSTAINSPRGQIFSVLKNNVEYKLVCLGNPKAPKEGLSPQLYKSAQNKFNEAFSNITRLVEISKQVGDGVIAPIDAFCGGRMICYVLPKHPRFVSITELIKCTDSVKLFAIKSFCVTLQKMHRLSIVHGYLSDNSLKVASSATGHQIIKISGLMDSFISQQPPHYPLLIPNEIYQSPEMSEYRQGHSEFKSRITCATDVFSSGILFHQIWCGDTPDYPGKKDGKFVYEAVAAGHKCTLDKSMPVWLQNVIQTMLMPLPENRPTMDNVFEEFSR